MLTAEVFLHSALAGYLRELEYGRRYSFEYHPQYNGPPVSLTMPVRTETYMYEEFPPFFDGLLPEGAQLEALLRHYKLDRNDKFGHLLRIGADTVGAVTIREAL